MERKMNEDEMIALIKAYANYNKNFNTDFIDSIEERIGEGYQLTEYQTEAMENIINKFHMKNVPGKHWCNCHQYHDLYDVEPDELGKPDFIYNKKGLYYTCGNCAYSRI
jgi:hypothetical protein